MPRRYISVATKAKAVDDWKSGRKSAKQIQAELKITSGLLSQWATDQKKRSDKDEQKSGEPAPETPYVAASTLPAVSGETQKRQRTDPAIKAMAVAEYENGKPAKEVGKQFGVSEQSIYAWKNQIQKKRNKEGNASAARVLSQPSGAGMDAGLTVLRKALTRMHRITCPACNFTFQADTPGYTEALVTLAAHLLNGEEP